MKSVLILSVMLTIWLGVMIAIGQFSLPIFIIPVLFILPWNITGVTYKKILFRPVIIVILIQTALYAISYAYAGVEFTNRMKYTIDASCVVIGFSAMLFSCTMYSVKTVNTLNHDLWTAEKCFRLSGAVMDVVYGCSAASLIILTVITDDKIRMIFPAVTMILVNRFTNMALRVYQRRKLSEMMSSEFTDVAGMSNEV